MLRGSEPLKDFIARFEHTFPKGYVRPDALDVLFTSSDGVTRLAHRILRYDHLSGEYVADIKIPIIRTDTDTVLFLYCTNPGAADTQDSSVYDNLLCEQSRDAEVPVYCTKAEQEAAKSRAMLDRLELQRRLITDLFGSDWIQDQVRLGRTKHRAIHDFQMLEQLIAQGGVIRVPDQLPLAHCYSVAMRDGMSLVTATAGDARTWSIGNLANYGDEEVLRRIRGVIRDSNQYEDVLVEIRTAAMLVMRGFAVTATEATGKADLTARHNDLPLPIVLDCKRLRPGTPTDSIRRLVKKSNQQVKNSTEPCYGGVVIDIGVCEMEIQGARHSDSCASPIQDCISILTNLLDRQFRSLTFARLTWSDLLTILPDSNTYPLVGISLSTTGRTVFHNSPHVTNVRLGDLIELGCASSFYIKGA